MLLSSDTIRNYLKQGSKLNWCNYCSKESMRMQGRIASKKREKAVIQLSLHDMFLKEWNSAREVHNEFGVHKASISACCTGKHKTAGGYKWMFKEDYEKYMSVSIS